MSKEHVLLACLAGLLDNPLTTLDQKRFILQKLVANDLSELRDALVNAKREHPLHPSLKSELQGPLPTKEEVESWLIKWSDRYQPLLACDEAPRRKWWRFW